ncbi:hypothetical protein DKX38_000010 [Salix brachista]|uniref:Uncharacterized protein n=1 Tax=Salix brachista TaxID=2182728 RepID=A0A5N5P252_9ROSI|nr:hypothetical protein DKX38_000010 [Salix brachista]
MLFCSGGGGCCPAARLFKHWFQAWLRDYDSLQHLALILIYVQIGCSLIGSLGALYNGILLINLAISLFALVAIESSSQRLGRTYAVLLFSSLLLDIAWFILFSRPIWNISSDDHGMFFVVSVKLTLVMEIIAFIVRLCSSLLWIQIYRLGVPYIDSTAPQEADFDLRSSFLSPITPAALARQCSDSDVVLGGSIYDPAYYSSLFEDGQDNKCLRGMKEELLLGGRSWHEGEVILQGNRKDQNYGICDNGSTSSAEASQVKVTLCRAFQAADVSIWKFIVYYVYLSQITALKLYYHNGLVEGIDTCTAFYSTDFYSRGGSCQSQSSKDHKSVLIRIEVYHVIRNAVLHEANLDWRGDWCSNSQRHLIGQVVPKRIIG